MKKYEKNGRRVCEDEIPPGYVVVDEYHPCSTVTPWDYYGMCHQREYAKVLTAAGISFVLLRTVETIIHPYGTGPGGMVRFGDNMLPGVFRIAVPKKQENAANVAIAAHKAAIAEWLKDICAPMPAACYD